MMGAVKVVLSPVRKFFDFRREKRAQVERLARETREHAERVAAERKRKCDLERQIQEVREHHARISREQEVRDAKERVERAQREDLERQQREAGEQIRREEVVRRQERRARLREARLSASDAQKFRNLVGERKAGLRELFQNYGLKTFGREWEERVFTKADNHLESPYASIRSRFNIKYKALVLELVFTPEKIVSCRFGRSSVSDPEWPAVLRFLDAELNALLSVAPNS